MPLSSSKKMDGNEKFVWDIFEKSPLMSTYIVAMAVVPKEYEVTRLNDGKRESSVWTSTYNEDKRNQILNMGTSLLSFFENYIGVKEMLPKIDHVQTTMLTSAMENWGLVLYAWSGMLEDSSVIAHELAHFWFGNLVTCKDWNE